MCGFRWAGVGAVSVTWQVLRSDLSRVAALRAMLVLGVLTRSDAKDALVLDGICVEEAHRGRGVGSALLAVAVQCAKAKELRAVRLSVVDTNPRAEALYRRTGFYPIRSGSMGFLSGIYGFDRYTHMERRVER